MKHAALALALAASTFCGTIDVAIADECEGADSGSYAAIASCGSDRLDNAESELGKQYERLISVTRNDVKIRNLAEESQRAWAIYRKSACSFWGDLLNYQIPWCLFEITMNRMEELKKAQTCLLNDATGPCDEEGTAQERTDPTLIYNDLLRAVSDDAERKSLVIESQRSWLSFREKDCAFWYGMTTSRPSWCTHHSDQHRYQLLKHMYGCYTEGGSEC